MLEHLNQDLVITSASHHNWWANRVRLVLLEGEAFISLHAFDNDLYLKENLSKSINNASLTPPRAADVIFIRT